jgi:hypothetical protein
MQFSGHRTASVFRRYDIIAPRDLAAASERLDAYLAGQPKPKVVPLRKAEGAVTRELSPRRRDGRWFD